MRLFITNPILIAAAVIPAVILLIVVYRADRMEQEPPRLILSLVFYGVLATFLAMVTERLGTWLLTRSGISEPAIYYAILYFGVVAISEEGFKYLLLKRRTWNCPDFNCQFDGIVYAISVSLGFALWENIGYVAMYGLSVAFLRAVTAIPGHACFGVFMGIWYGFAKKHENRGNYGLSLLCRVLAVVFPILLHGAYDYTASFTNPSYAWVFAAFAAVMFIAAFFLVRRMAREDQWIDDDPYGGFTGDYGDRYDDGFGGRYRY